jgi:hypothetical protein
MSSQFKRDQVQIRDPVTGHLKKGSRLNPSGRNGSRSPLWNMLDQMLGDNAVECYVFAANVMRGTASGPARKPAPGEDVSSAALIPLVPPTIRERLDAAQWLAEQRNGRAPSTTSLELSGSLELPNVRINPEKLTDDELERLEALTLKALETGETVDGEFVESPPKALP